MERSSKLKIFFWNTYFIRRSVSDLLDQCCERLNRRDFGDFTAPDAREEILRQPAHIQRLFIAGKDVISDLLGENDRQRSTVYRCFGQLVVVIIQNI